MYLIDEVHTITSRTADRMLSLLEELPPHVLLIGTTTESNWTDEYEIEVRVERVRAGQATARAKGKRWGGSKPGRFCKVTPDQFAAIRKMSDEGQKIARIARITGLSRPTVYRVLSHVDAAETITRAARASAS